RTNQANAVVIPQVGQSRPVRLANVHGRRPSWVCVPYPFGSGTNALDNPRTPASRSAAITTRPPVRRPSRCIRRVGFVTAGPRDRWVIADRSPDREGPADRTHYSIFGSGAGKACL